MNKKQDLHKLIDSFDYSKIAYLDEYEFYKFDIVDKAVIYDAILWIENSGGIYSKKPSTAKLGTLTRNEVLALINYKGTFFSAKLNSKAQQLYNTVVSAVDKATKLYGKTVSKTLFRGVLDEELKSILKVCKNKKLVQLNRIKSFTTSKENAYEFGDSIMSLKSNDVKLFDFNSFLVSIGLALAITKKSSNDMALAFLDGYDDNSMDEYIVSTRCKFNVVDLRKLKFELVNAASN